MPSLILCSKLSKTQKGPTLAKPIFDDQIKQKQKNQTGDSSIANFRAVRLLVGRMATAGLLAILSPAEQLSDLLDEAPLDRLDFLYFGHLFLQF